MFFIFYVLKKTISDIVLNLDYCIINLPSDFFAGLIALFLRYPIKGLIWDFFETLEQEEIFFLNPDGSGQGTGGPSGEGSAEDKGKGKEN